MSSSGRSADGGGRRSPAAGLVAAALLAAACNRAGFRIPGLSTDFPETFSGYRAAHPVGEAVTIVPATDSRRAHYGERIAGTRWKACSTDSFRESGARVVEDRLAAEVERSELTRWPTACARCPRTCSGRSTAWS